MMADDIDVLLREHFAGPVPVGDFPERVMNRLPARRTRGRLPLIAGGCVGAAMCWLSLWLSPLSQIAGRDWLSGTLSGDAIAMFVAMLGMSLLALAWSITETDDGWNPSPLVTSR